MNIIDRASSGKQHLQKIKEEQRQAERQEKREEERLEELEENVRIALERISRHLELVRGGYDNDERWGGKELIVEDYDAGPSGTFELNVIGLEYQLMSVKVEIHRPGHFEDNRVPPDSEEKTETLLKLNFKSDNTKLFLPEELRDGTYETRSSTAHAEEFREIDALMEEILHLLAPSCSEKSLKAAVEAIL